MASAAVEKVPPASPVLPDYLLNANAILGDKSATWRYGQLPDYTNTRRVFEQTKSRSHTPGSLPDLVQNLVKNWEIEASFKTNIGDWRTVDRHNYTFSINSGPPQSAEHMLKVGTYNAIIAPNEFYSPETSDFASSHKTFKRMMPTFAWEVLEVYSGPPVASFKWRHWGMMKNDYVGYNDKGEKVTAKAHGGPIDIQGMTVAHLDDQLRIVKLETWFDPLEMFRQIAPNGIVNKTVGNPALSLEVPHQPEQVKNEGEPEEDVEPMVEENGAEKNEEKATQKVEVSSEQSPIPSRHLDLKKLITNLSTAVDALKLGLNLIQDASLTPSPASSSSTTQSWITVRSGDDNDGKVDVSGPLHTENVDRDGKNRPAPGNATVTAPTEIETQLSHQEMNHITKLECPFFNQE